MRSRNIKPGIFKNELLGVEDPILTIVFMGLWCAADRNGVLEDRPLRLRAEILPYKTDVDFNALLTVLSRLEFIHRYEVDKNKYIQVINFKKHQRPHHTEKGSGLPEYTVNSNGCDLTEVSPLDHRKNPPDSLIPDSLIPDSLIPSSNDFSPEIKNFVRTYQEYVSNAFGKLAPKITDAFLLKCCKTVTQLIEIDKFTFQEINDSIKWASNDAFWSLQLKSLANIRSNAKNGEKKFINMFTAYKNKGVKPLTNADRITQANLEAGRKFLNGE